MKKILKYIAAVPMLYAAMTAEAREHPFFSVSEFTGAFYGQMSEYVYADNRLLSRLDWDEHYTPFVGIIGNMTWYNVCASVELFTAIPRNSGKMRDYDWMYITNSGGYTHYSEHTAYNDEHLEMKLRLGYEFHFGRWSIIPQIGFMYSQRCWTATNGYTQYPSTAAENAYESWSPNYSKDIILGFVDIYEIKTKYGFASLQAGYHFSDRFEITAVARYAPYINIKAIDWHLLRLEYFYDVMKGGYGVGGFLTAKYHPSSTNKVSFYAELGWKGIFSAKGTTFAGDMGESEGVFKAKDSYSQVNSKLWWMLVGITLYPQRWFEK